MTTDSDQNIPLITISVPVYNEEDNIEPLMARLKTFAKKESAYRFEFLFTDNASNDRTFEKLVEEADKDPRIRVLRFSRNFGFQKSILTNFLNARGVAAVQMDADLQDPPELISQFLKEWESGYKVVYGVRRGRKEHWILHTSRKWFYRFLEWLSETYVPPDVGDFRLIDRLIIDQLRSVQEQAPYLRGLIANMGYPQKGIPYDRDERKAGSSKFGLFALVTFGLDGITSQSTRPLRLITLFGFGLCLITIIISGCYVLIALTGIKELPPGWSTLVVLALGSIGLNAFFLGLLGEYLGRVFNNTRGLAISIIERRIEAKVEQTSEETLPEKGK